MTATVPERPEFDGSVAARLAAMRAEAVFALWALPHGADAEAAWRECPRADWLVDTAALGRAYAPGSEVHRRVVFALATLAGELARRYLGEVFAFEAVVFTVVGWCRGELDPHLVVRMTDALAARVGLAARQQEAPGGDRRLVAAFAVHLAASTVVDPRAASGAALATSVGLSGLAESREVADFVRWLVPMPEELGP